MPDKTPAQIMLEHGFHWFEYHAHQRIVTFRLYLVIYSSLAAADSFLLKENIQSGTLLVPSIMIVLSVLFWQLDLRNRQLITIGETIISHAWSESRLDTRLDPVIQSATKQTSGLRFRQLFNAVFALGAAAAVAMLAHSMIR
jgi:hypothetical protein